MSVLINGMEMPTSCPCELLGIGYDLYCSFAGGIPARVKEYYECCQNGTRPSWCPLVPVQPHGRLIDADANLEVMRRVYNCPSTSCGTVDSAMLRACIKMFEEAPTIIPAEEGEI